MKASQWGKSLISISNTNIIASQVCEKKRLIFLEGVYQHLYAHIMPPEAMQMANMINLSSVIPTL
jgi:hypothetical protein